jgi:hypothetical protein
MDPTMLDFLWLMVVWIYGSFFLALFLGSFIRAGNR